MEPATTERIEAILKDRFKPVYFELRDESSDHVGHKGATSGGGHYQVTLVSSAFDGLPRLDQHRLVNAALADLIGNEIHALGLKTYSTSEWGS